MSTFMDVWRSFHGEVTPVAYRLKHEKAHLWQRFHSLPDSQRYVTTDAEMAIVLDRQNTLADEVLGEGAPCWLIGYYYQFDGVASPDDAWDKDHADYPEIKGLSRVHTVTDPDDPEDVLDIFAGRTVWRSGAFDAVLRDIAEDRVRVMWMSETTGAVLAPYDGGVDLILPNMDILRDLIVRHSDWLSTTRGGC